MSLDDNKWTRTGIAPAATSCWRFSSLWVMLSKAPVALRWTRMSLLLARRVSGPKAPERAIRDLFSSGGVLEISRRKLSRTGPDRTEPLTMGGQVGDATDGVALDLDVGREHLPDQGFQASEFDDRELVVGVDGEVAERGARGPLHLDVVRTQQEQDGFEGLARDFADVLFGDFGKREGCGPLQVDIVRVREGRQGAQGFPGEKVGVLAVLEVLEQVGDGFAFVVEQEGLVRLVRRRGCAVGGLVS